MIVFLHGHGSWAPSMGYTQVPKDCSVSFYTHFAKLLNQTMVEKIFNGTHVGPLDRTVPQYHTVPNLRMSSLTIAQRNWADNKFNTGPFDDEYALLMLDASPPVQRMNLAEMMQGVAKQGIGPIEFRWLCCQSLTLNQVGGRAFGLNASDRTAQTGHEGHYLFKWKDQNGNAQEKWVRSNSTIHR